MLSAGHNVLIRTPLSEDAVPLDPRIAARDAMTPPSVSNEVACRWLPAQRHPAHEARRSEEPMLQGINGRFQAGGASMARQQHKGTS